METELAATPRLPRGDAVDVTLRLDVRKRPFPAQVETSEANVSAHTIIVATGADSRWLGIDGEEDFKGGGVSSCATCDG